MDENKFIKEYLDRYRSTIFQQETVILLKELKHILIDTNKRGNSVIIVGNGGSAAIASHVSVDFTKQAGIKAMNFNESNLITSFSNDYGYERWVEKALEFYARIGDIVILISSSGESMNLINAARFAKKNGLRIITFTGFSSKNQLKLLGDLNFWVNSKAYNIIENTHLIWLLTVCDLIIGKVEYSVK